MKQQQQQRDREVSQARISREEAKEQAAMATNKDRQGEVIVGLGARARNKNQPRSVYLERSIVASCHTGLSKCTSTPTTE